MNRAITTAEFTELRTLCGVSSLLRQTTTDGDRAFLSERDVELLLRVVTCGLVATVDCVHTTYMLSHSPSERTNVPFSTVGTVACVAHRTNKTEQTARFFCAPLIALPLVGNQHYSLIVLDTEAQRVHHFDSMPGLHNELLLALLAHQHQWMFPSLGASPTKEQLAERVNRLYHHQTRSNCGICVVRVLAGLELRMSKHPGCMTNQHHRSDTMTATFVEALTNDADVDAYRLQLADEIDDLMRTFLLASTCNDSLTGAKEPARRLLPDNMRVASVHDYLLRRAVEGHTVSAWMRQRFHWFAVESKISAELLRALARSPQMGVLIVVCDSVGAVVIGAYLVLAASSHNESWTFVGDQNAITASRQHIETALRTLQGKCDLYYTPPCADRLSTTLHVASVLDAKLWNAGNNQRGWIEQHGRETLAEIVREMVVPRNGKSSDAPSEILADRCYGALARITRAHLMRAREESNSILRDQDPLVRVTQLYSDPVDVSVSHQRMINLGQAMSERQEALVQRLHHTKIPCVEYCSKKSSIIYRYIGCNASLLDLLRDCNRFINDACVINTLHGYVVDVAVLLARIFPVVFCSSFSARRCTVVTHYDRIFTVVTSVREFPIVCPVVVFNTVVTLQQQQKQQQCAQNKAAVTFQTKKFDAAESPTHGDSSALHEKRQFACIMSLVDVLDKINNNEMELENPRTPLTDEEKKFTMEMHGRCTLWPPESEERKRTMEFATFCAGLSTKSSVDYFGFDDERFPWVSVIIRQQDVEMQQ